MCGSTEALRLSPQRTEPRWPLRYVAIATYQPPVYDYGVNVVYQGDEVYVDGQPAATAQEYSQQAIALANAPAAQPPPPNPPEPGQQLSGCRWASGLSLQEEKGDAYMFFQISIVKDGVVS